jgi:hypothetical protein
VAAAVVFPLISNGIYWYLAYTHALQNPRPAPAPGWVMVLLLAIPPLLSAAWAWRRGLRVRRIGLVAITSVGCFFVWFELTLVVVLRSS